MVQTRMIPATSALLCLTVALACGRAHQTSDTPHDTSTASACDDYMRVVTKCIETKTPDDERAEARAGLERFQRSLKAFPISAATAASQCSTSLVLTMRQDDYGCYGEEAVRLHVQTACTILTRGELESIVHESLQDGIPGNQKCTYHVAGNELAEPIVVTVHWKDGKDEVLAARAAKALVAGRLTKQFGKGAGETVAGETVDVVGDEAYFTLAGLHTMFVARLGDVAVGVEGADENQLIAIAKLALPRITPDPGGRP